MNLFRKDKSWVNKIIFPAPKPAMYTPKTFMSSDRTRGRMVWIPRRQAAVRRNSKAHDPNSVPCLLMECRYPGSDRVLLYCHGNSEDLGNSPGILSRLRDTLRVHVMGVEYPGYGISSGTPSESGLNNDILVVYMFLTGVLGFKPENILLFGYSIGTGPTTHLAGLKQVGGLVLVAPYSSIRDMVSCVLPKSVGRAAQYLISDRFVNKEQIKKVTCPVLFVHGKADSLIPFSHSELLHKNCKSEKKQLYLADTLDHCYDDDDFEAYILFPVMTFFEGKRGRARMMKLPEYVLTPPPDKPVEDTESSLSSAIADASPLADDNADTADDDDKKDELEEAEWPCAQCTYMNMPYEKFCQLCQAAKPKPVKEWNCGACTYVNRFREDACDMCGTRRSSSANSKGDADSSSSSADNNKFSPDQLFSPDVPAGPVSLFDRAQQMSNGLDELTGKSQWACGLCTLLNEPQTHRCIACGSPRM